VKVGGVPLYKAARAGRTVARGPREVTVYAIEVLGIEGRDVSLSVRCSKGTYIRTLCADIGEALQVGGHLLTLERTRVGPLGIERALTVEEVQSRFLLGRLAEDLVTLDQALDRFPALTVEDATARRVLHGVPVPHRSVAGTEGGRSVDLTAGQLVRLKDAAGRLLALGLVRERSGAHQGGGSEGSGWTIAIQKVLTDSR
jgi:tRNA pseudouridine55 synthase